MNEIIHRGQRETCGMMASGLEGAFTCRKAT